MAPSSPPRPAHVPDARDFQSFFEMANVGNIIADPQTGRFLRVNRRFCEITGYSESELQELSSFDLTHPEDLAEDREGWEKALASHEDSFTIEKRYRRKDGRVAWVHVTSTMVRDEADRPLRAIGVVRDVTDRRQAREELARTRAELESRVVQRTAELAAATQAAHSSAYYFETLIKHSPLAILSVDLEHRVRLWNPAAERMFGWRAEEVIGHYLPILPDVDRAHYDAEMRRMGEVAELREYATKRQCRNGTVLDVVVWRAPLFDAENRLYASMAILMDVTRRKFLESAVLIATERESRRIGQELHDHLCQDLLGAAFSAKALAMKLSAASEAATELHDLARLINSAVRQARDIARGLNPVEINSAGLMSALEELVERPRAGIACRLECARPVLLPDAEAALHAYRIAQEAVINATRHSGCTDIVIRLTEDTREIRLEIADNGTGMTAEANSPGSGLKIMELRAAALSGKLSIHTTIQQGTHVTCVLPKT